MISLLRQRNFALLWFGSLISLTGDWMLLIALPIYVYQLSGSALATSITVMTRIIPRLLLGSLAGVFVDRWDRKQTMIISNLLLALNLLPLLLVQSVEWLWLIYLVSFIQSVISQFFGPAENALLVQVVGEEELVTANSLNALNNNLARVVGPSLGGLVALLFELSGIALIDAATFIIAGGMIALVTTSGQLGQSSAQAGASRTALWQEWWEGLRLVWREPVVSLLFAMIILTSLGEGVFSVIFLIWVDKVFGGGALEVGWFMTAQGVGGILGGFIIGGLGNRVAPFKLLGLGALGIGLLDFALFNYPLFFSEIWLGLGFIFVVGIPAVGFGTGWNTLLQRSVPDAYLGRVFGAYSMVGGLLLLVGTSLAGAIGNKVEPILLLNVQSGVYMLAGLFALVTLGKVSQMRLGGVAQEQTLEPAAGN